jgi:hypothetical protein
LNVTSLLTPLPASTVLVPVTLTGPLKVILLPFDVTFAANLTTPVPAVVKLIGPLPETLLPTLMLPLPLASLKVMPPPALMLTPLWISMPAVESAPTNPAKLVPSNVKLPPLLMDAPLCKKTPPTPLFVRSPCKVKLTPALEVSAPVKMT